MSGADKFSNVEQIEFLPKAVFFSHKDENDNEEKIDYYLN